MSFMNYANKKILNEETKQAIADIMQAHQIDIDYEDFIKIVKDIKTIVKKNRKAAPGEGEILWAIQIAAKEYDELIKNTITEETETVVDWL